MAVRFFYRAGRGFTQLPFWIYRLVEYRLGDRPAGLPVVGLHTVFIARENILFLKEWVLYHRLKGIDHFFLYDNTGSTCSSQSVESSPHTVHGRVSKYGVPYDELVRLSPEEVQYILDEIEREIPGVRVVKWRPRDEDGKIMHAQIQAHNDALSQYGEIVDWMCVHGHGRVPGIGRVRTGAMQVAGVARVRRRPHVRPTDRCPPGSTTWIDT